MRNKKHFLLVFMLNAICSYLMAQDQPGDLSKVITSRDAGQYVINNAKWEAKLFHVAFSENAAELFSQLYSKKPGYIFTVADYSYKLIEFDSLLVYRVSYIYLDGNKLKKEEVDRTRQLIISHYKSGASFADLASEYSMDGNISGDTNWFAEGVMTPEFEAAVKSHQKGDIFTVDTPSQNWYHVVLKTHDAVYKKNFTLLKVRNSN